LTNELVNAHISAAQISDLLEQGVDVPSGLAGTDPDLHLLLCSIRDGALSFMLVDKHIKMLQIFVYTSALLAKTSKQQK
jgi:hypothetical protein